MQASVRRRATQIFSMHLLRTLSGEEARTLGTVARGLHHRSKMLDYLLFARSAEQYRKKALRGELIPDCSPVLARAAANRYHEVSRAGDTKWGAVQGAFSRVEESVIPASLILATWLCSRSPELVWTAEDSVAKLGTGTTAEFVALFRNRIPFSLVSPWYSVRMFFGRVKRSSAAYGLVKWHI